MNRMHHTATADEARTFRAMRLAAVCILTIIAMACTTGAAAWAREKAVAWKPVQDALLRVDDHPAKEWNLYQWGKKTDPLLLELNGRFLLLEIHDQRIYEIPASKIEHKGNELIWAASDRPDKPLETASWTVRDVGLAYKFTLRLVAENHVLDVQLPHPLDIRSVVR